jgi:hypothetical protein
MSYADKTYVNKEQYIQAREFWIQTRKQQKKELGYEQWLYPFQSFEDIHDTDDITDELLATNIDIDEFGDVEYTLWNTGTLFDMWLMKNCPLDFIQERLKEQYQENFIGWKFKDQIDFTKKSYLAIISNDKEDFKLYFFRTEGDDLEDGEINFHDKIIFYGTTFLLKVIDDAFKCIKGINRHDTMELVVEFLYYGIKLKYENNEITEVETGEKVTLGYIINEDEVFFKPKFKHSYNSKDIKKIRKRRNIPVS